MKRIAVLVSIVMLALSAPLAHSAPQSGAQGTYDGPGTVVLALEEPELGSLTLLDNGAVACTDTGYAAGTAAGRGGVCIPFGEMQGDSIQVDDAEHGDKVAFQVCVDVSGDGICTANGARDPCADRVVFSHASANSTFHNPLYIPPQFASRFASCESDGFPGYIVILCAGVHRDFDETTAHTHDVTTGTVTDVTTGGGTGAGDYCGGPFAEKAYVVV